MRRRTFTSWIAGGTRRWRTRRSTGRCLLDLSRIEATWLTSSFIPRIHRFGQTSEVYVTRFLISPSIDDKMQGGLRFSSFAAVVRN